MAKSMKMVPLVFGLIAMALGALWFLQGLDMVHVQPLLCFSDCAPVRGASLKWALLGVALFAAGGAAVWWALKRQSKSAATKTGRSE